MSWQQLFCKTSRQHEATISTLLEENDAASVTYQDAENTPVLEPLPGQTPLWEKMVIIGMFQADQQLESLIEKLHQAFPDQLTIHTETLEEQQWERSWMDNFHPMKFGNNLWIYPTHTEHPNDDSTTILLDPGLAFGTGTHPTTALCLEWLDQHPPKDLTLIDYGCGSGVLAIAAIKLGARHTIATDIDEQALTATQNNMLTNAIDTNQINTCLPEAIPQEKVDIILANILSGPLAVLASDLAERVKAHGTIVLSGILIEQEQSIIDAYSPWFEDLNICFNEEWLRITGTKKP